MDKTQLEQDAERALTKAGLPVTPILKEVSMAAIDMARRVRTPDYPLHSVTKDTAHRTVAFAGQARALRAMEQNDRMAALRLNGLDIPAHPSVQDVAGAVLEACVADAVREALEADDATIKPGDPRMN